MASNRPIRVGLLGCGRIARRVHLPALSRLPGLEVAAVAEADAGHREACRALAPGAQWFSDYRALLEAVPLDAVVICLPPALHADAAIASFDLGLHVYLEKPLAITREDGERIVRAWQSAGTAGWMGFNYRFHPLVVRLREALARGKIGDVIAAHTTFCAPARTLPAWKRLRDCGGGVLLDLASHQFDLVRFVLGQEIAAVQCLTESIASEADTAFIQLHLRAGTMVQVFISLCAVEQHRMEIIGSGGQLEFDRYRSPRLRVTPPHRDFRKMARVRAATGLIVDLPLALRTALLPQRERSYGLALSAFADAVRGRIAHGPDLAAGLASLDAVLAAEQAAHTGSLVHLAAPLEGH